MKQKLISLFIIIGTLIFSVENQIMDFSNLGIPIEGTMNQPFLSDLGQRIRENVFKSLESTRDLGTRIQQEVQQNLLPVEAMALRQQMINGQNGKTIIRFPTGKTILAENNVRYECIGNMQENGICNGRLIPIGFDNKENFCYMNPNSRVNNYLCFTSGNSISVSNVNGDITCKSEKNAKVLLISQEDYKQMCAHLGGDPIYKYISNLNNPFTVKIPNTNPFIKCQNNTPNVCIFT